MSRSIFVSKPNSLSPVQTQFCIRFFDFLKSRGFNPRTLGQTDFPNESPINAVRTVLEECSGAIVLGLNQTFVKEGLHKAHTPDEASLQNCYLPTPWNQIEAGMAFVSRQPLLILKERGIKGGIFDAGSTDRFIHQADLTEEYLSSSRFLQPFHAWQEEVILLSTPGGSR